MKQTGNFIQGPILSPLLRFTLPVLLALFLQAMYGAVDLMVVGQFGQPADVSAVSTGSQVMHTVHRLFQRAGKHRFRHGSGHCEGVFGAHSGIPVHEPPGTRVSVSGGAGNAMLHAGPDRAVPGVLRFHRRPGPTDGNNEVRRQKTRPAAVPFAVTIFSPKSRCFHNAKAAQ